MPDGPAAPSPVIPTYRPSEKFSGSPTKLSIMPTVALTDYKQYTRIPGLRKPRPRSAGASSRPMRSENIAELVRFFQTPEETEAESVIGSQINDMDLLKAGQRRLRDMGQTKSGRSSIKSSGASSSSEKLKTQRQHLVALQREGLLPGLEDLGGNKPRSSRTKHVRHDKEGLLPSLEDLTDKSRPSRTKQDVEAIGRPWLDDALTSIPKSEERSTSQIELPLHDLRSESLSLGDLAALVEFSASFPELYSHDSDPPPYQAKAQSQPHLPAHASNSNSAAAPSREDHGRNENSRQLGNTAESHSRDSRPERDTLTLNKPAQGHQVAINRQPQNRPDTSKNDDDSSCGSNSDFDDAKSLAVLLRATERLGLEKKRTSQKAPLAEPSSGVANGVPAAAATTTTTASGAIKDNTAPHSLNQGVTDTPLFVRNLLENKHDGAEAAKKINAKASRSTDQLLPLSQADANLPNHLNAGPIPLKLVAECMPPSISKPDSSQPLNTFVPRPSSNLNDETNLLQPPSTVVGPSSASFPRPRALLSPIPIQSRRARSVTPDVASGMYIKGKKKGKKAPLYVVTDAAPLPPPAKPLPSLPQSADALVGPKPIQGDRSASTPAQPASAPLEYREEDRDSPVLGMNPRKLHLQRSLIGSRPSSRYSNRSTDASDASHNSSDDQSSRTASPTVSRPESQQGRAIHVHAIRMRDIDAKKRKYAPGVKTSAHAGSGMHSLKHDGRYQPQPESRGQTDQVRFSRWNRISTVPEFPLPKNPPLNAQGAPHIRRRNSTTSLPGSISTLNGYEGGLSRSVSVTSGSIDSFSIKHGKTAILPANATKNLSHSNFQPQSPLLPSSDDEMHDPRPRRLKNNISIRDNGESETRQVNQRLANAKSKQSIKQEATLKYQNLSSLSEDLLHSLPPGAGDSHISYVNVLHHLESRIATLERQNKMLQAALLAALDVGVSHDAGSAQSRSSSPASSSMRVPTISERAMPSSNNLGIDSARRKQGKATQRYHASRNLYAHDAASQGSRGSFETTSSHSDSSIRPVEGVLSNPDAGGWNEAIRKNRK
ncbi:hypothetical protein UA08_01470 [Talaromyces atroroseus]|uniref:Uncharacterized protein n=1 Tax=Talaromyces atroroseus TaxID=1441469 RepID=A0A1Q5QBW3_TALAT|nr:hypothetical protein UA08_01470 [Talaromyces atroroseus]OKL63308.1 hypothetical protein UA08_01470 [Talaromyces atroroseus]